MTNIYILDFGNRIKIGKSNRPLQRIKTIENAAGEKVKQMFYLETESTKEKILQTYLQEYRTVGEYFTCSFDIAKFALQDILDGKIKIERKRKAEIKEPTRKYAKRKSNMAISYDRLWKLLIDKKLKKTDLKSMASLSPNTLAKLGKDEIVDMQSLLKICDALNCSLNDIVNYPQNVEAGE